VEDVGVFEFLVDSINDAGLIVGRNGDRDIPVGTTFTEVWRCRVRRDANGLGSEDVEVVGPVSLTVREVHWFQRTIDAVPRGHTAALAVSGEGLEWLARLLGSLPQREYLSLVGFTP
jgi:hypothetical protein